MLTLSILLATSLGFTPSQVPGPTTSPTEEAPDEASKPPTEASAPPDGVEPSVPEALEAPGTVLMWAVQDGDAAGNDYEFVVTLTAVDGDLVYDWRMGPPKGESGSRTVPTRWRRESRLIDNLYRGDKKARFASTSLAASEQMLERARGDTPQKIAFAGSVPFDMAVAEHIAFSITFDDEEHWLPALSLTGAKGATLVFLDHPSLPLVLSVDGPWTSRLVGVRGGDPAQRAKEALDRDGLLTSYGVRFEVASATLTPESEPVLTAVAEWLSENPAARLMVEGHTDAQGSNDANQTLSEQRAAAVQAWIETHGVEPGRLDLEGFGESRPVGSNHTLKGRAANRRVVFRALVAP